MAQQVTADDFLGRGAAFGIQVRRAREERSMKSARCHRWENAATLLYSKVRGVETH
jgi:hypothetical protein